MRIRLLFISLTLLTVLLSCGKEQEPLPKSIRSDRDAQQTLSQAKLTAFDDTVRVWELLTDYLSRSGLNNVIHLAPVHLKMFDDTGKVTTTVTSDSGTTTESMDSFYIWSNVYIVNDDGSTVRSHSLGWAQKSRKFSSIDRVVITTGDGEKMSGVGFHATEDFSEWTFLDSVTGEFNDFELEGDDEEF